MKDINISDGIFIRSPGSCPRGRTWAYRGGWVVQFFFQNSIRLVRELLTSMAHATAQFFWSPPPGALGRGQKLKYKKISITKSISKIFKRNFVCLLTNERYKTYQTGFSFGRLGHAPGVGLRGTVGVGWSNFFSPKFNQIWCVSYLHQWHMQRHNCFGPYPWGHVEGPKGQIS